MLLTLNQFKTIYVSLDNLWAASLKFGEHDYIVVSSTKLQTPISWMKNIKSFIKMLNRVGPKIEPCGTYKNGSYFYPLISFRKVMKY